MAEEQEDPYALYLKGLTDLKQTTTVGTPSGEPVKEFEKSKAAAGGETSLLPPLKPQESPYLDLAAGLLGGALGRKIPGLPRGVGAVLGSVLGTGGTELGWQSLKRAEDMPGAPDNFDQSARIASGAALTQGIGEATGQFAGPMLPNSPGVPDPDRLAISQAIHDNLRSAYERIGGQPMVVDYRSRWNPMRIFQPLDTELDNQSVVDNLKAAGMDPKMARRIVLQNGATTAEVLDNAPYRIMQSLAESSPISRGYMQRYQGTRAKLYEGMVQDLADQFGKAVSPQALGSVVAKAVDGNFGLATKISDNSLNGVGGILPDGFKLNVQGIRTYMKNNGLDMNGPIAKALFGDPAGNGIPGKIGWNDLRDMRRNVSSIYHDLSMDPAVRAEAGTALRTLDRSVMKQLPPGQAETWYDLGTKADDVVNDGQFRDTFVQRMIKNPDAIDAYSNKTLKDTNINNWLKFEKAVGPAAADQVRANMAQKLLQGAVDDRGNFDPNKLHEILSAHGRFGSAFGNAVFGPQWMDNVGRVQDAVNLVKNAAR